MPTISQRCALLSRESPGVYASILAQAIPLAAFGEVEPLGNQLVKVGRGEAVASILGDTRSAKALQQPLTRCPGSLLVWAARKLVADRNLSGAIATATILQARLDEGRTESGDLHALILLLEMDNREICALADEILVGLACATLRGSRGLKALPGRSPTEATVTIDGGLLQALAGAIEKRVARDSSRSAQRAGLAAAIFALVPRSPIAALMQNPDHPVLIAARRSLRHVKEPLVARNLLHWVAYEPLAGTARRWIADALMDPEVIHHVLESGHLLRRGQVRQRLKASAAGARCLPPLGTHAQWPRTSKRAMAALIQALPLSQGRRIEALCDLIAVDDVQARCRAVIALSCYQDQQATEALVHFCMDPHQAVVRAATDALQTRSLDRAELVRLAQRSRGRIASWARCQLAQSRAEDFIAFWPHLTSQERLDCAIELRIRSDVDFRRAVDALLLDGERWTVVGVMQVLRQMTLTGDFEDRLIELSAASDSRIASTAVASLGDAPSPRTVSVITARLSHPDDRVQANAVEAMGNFNRVFPGRISPQQIGRVIAPLTLQAGNRTRANAIVVLSEFYPELAVHRLDHMLKDANPLYRASAIWAARQCNAHSSLGYLKRMAETESVPMLQQRANEAAEFITREQPTAVLTSGAQENQSELATASRLGRVVESHVHV